MSSASAHERPLGSSNKRFRTAAVVLNYCTPELTIQAAKSLACQMDPELDRVVVVDNDSPDGSADIIAAHLEKEGLPHVFLVRSPQNGGFSYGNNVGIRAVDAEEYLLLNSDTIVGSDAVAILRQGLRSSLQIGIASPTLQFEDGVPQISCFRDHTPLSELINGAQIGPVTRLLSRWDVPLGVQTSPTDVEWTSFACVMIRSEVFSRVGLLDEGFFMYYEDADFCRKVRNAGFRVVHFPEAKVVHLRGKSSPVKEASRQRKRRPKYYYDSRDRYFRQSYGVVGSISANVLWTLGRTLALPRELSGRRQSHTVSYELKDLWRATVDSFMKRE